MSLDLAETRAERAAVALIAGPGARLTGRYGGRAQVPGTNSRPYHPAIDIAGAAVGAKVPLYSPRAFAETWYSGKDGAGALDLFLGDLDDGLRFVHNERHLHIKGAVHRGQPVAVMGTTGNSNGVHVHLERYEGGRLVDPLPWLISLLPKTTPTTHDTEEDTMRVFANTKTQAWGVVGGFGFRPVREGAGAAILRAAGQAEPDRIPDAEFNALQRTFTG